MNDLSRAGLPQQVHGAANFVAVGKPNARSAGDPASKPPTEKADCPSAKAMKEGTPHGAIAWGIRRVAPASHSPHAADLTQWSQYSDGKDETRSREAAERRGAEVGISAAGVGHAAPGSSPAADLPSRDARQANRAGLFQGGRCLLDAAEVPQELSAAILLGRVAEVPHRQTLGEPRVDLLARGVLIPGAFSEVNCGLKSHLRETETAPTSRAIPSKEAGSYSPARVADLASVSTSGQSNRPGGVLAVLRAGHLLEVADTISLEARS